MRSRRMVSALFALFFLVTPVFSQDFFFKKGDVVFVMGDSITEQRLYSNYLELWSITRFPQYNLVFRNVGISGDRSPGGNGRFKRDVLPYKPTVLTVDFGMNDGSYQPFSEKTFDPYMKGLQGIADQAKSAGVRVAWVTPQPVEHNPGEEKEVYNKTLEKFSEGVAEIAKKNNGLFVDQFHPYWAVVQKARDAGEKKRITGGDAVHPGPPGQALMAASILKGMNFPREVSSATIDATGKNPPKTKNCQVKDLQLKDGIRFERLDAALPFFPEPAKAILKFTPLLEEMNDYRLQVTGLSAGNYEVRLGGKKAAEYAAEDLAKGVNLAEAALTVGPIADQVKEVTKAVNDKTNFYHGQIFRGLVLANAAKIPEFKDLGPKELEAKKQELMTERLQKMPALDAAIQQAVQPRPCLVEVIAVK